MGFFGKKKDKEKKGFFGWKKRKQEEELEREAEIVPPESESDSDDIAVQLLAEREAARQAEAERWREQAEAEVAVEQAEAAALAAKAAQEELLAEVDEEDEEEEPELDEELETETAEAAAVEIEVEEDNPEPDEIGNQQVEKPLESEEEEKSELEEPGEEPAAAALESEEKSELETADAEDKTELEEPEEEPAAAALESEEKLEIADAEDRAELDETEKEPAAAALESEKKSETADADEELEPEESENTSAEESLEEPEKKKKGLFQKIRDGLRKTKDSVIAKMQLVLNAFTKIDEDLFDQLEETMIMGDMGAETSIEICDQLRKRVKERGITDPKQIMGLIQEIIGEMLGEDQSLNLHTKPSVIMVIGVNGAGKTTTIGKLCHQLKEDGKKVIVAAADTFRAAAIDQLQVWTDRAGVELVKHAEGSDPAAVVYDAIEAAKARDCDVLICDTAGRLHNKKNLMQELAKINRIIENKAAGCDTEILLVLDATTGQNAVNQARLFQEVADITGIVLTKLDGTAKGGIVVSIKNELQIPVKLIGVGEKIDDLQPFHAKDFVNALFEKEERL